MRCGGTLCPSPREAGRGESRPYFFLGGTGAWATVLLPDFDLVQGATAKKNFAGLVAT